jgi:dephospho-CoA kinase
VVAGGLGSGKSTVAQLLAAKGATTIDADQIGHEVLEQGGPAYAPVAERWPVVVVDGAIDRQRLAVIVFSDPEQLGELEAITHPAIGAEIARRAREAAGGPVVVELPVPTIVAPDWTWIVVVADPSLRVERAVARGMEEDDARRRIASQLTEREWRERATHVIVNNGTLAELRGEVDALWEDLARA